MNKHKKILITCDSAADLPPELIEQYGIQILPLTIAFGDETFTDGIDITPDELYKRYAKTKQLPKTSAVNVADCTLFFHWLTEQGYTIIHFSISSELSSTYNHCCIAAQKMNNVYVIDSQNLSSGITLLIITAAELAKQGKTATEIADYCSKLRNDIHTSFVVDNLEFLRKGGRCSSLEALGANLLHIKPCIVVQNGKMTVGHKYRGKFSKVLNNYIHNELTNPENIVSDFIFLTHAGCEETLIQQCKEEIQKLVPDKKILIVKAGCTISSHCGPNTLGVIYLSSHAA